MLRAIALCPTTIKDSNYFRPHLNMKQAKPALQFRDFNGSGKLETAKMAKPTKLTQERKATAVLDKSPIPVAQPVTTENPTSTSGTEVDITSPCHESHPSKGWKWLPHHLSIPEMWEKIRQEAKIDAENEVTLASFLHTSVLVHSSIPKTMAFILANKLACTTLLGPHLMKLFQDIYDDDPFIIEACCADMQAVIDRDPACEKYTQCMLYFKGFQAVQSQRLAHWLYNKGRKALAIALQSRISEAFHVDIHPAAVIGRGFMLDHATGVVIGETAVIKDNVSMLHHVTLGGSGTGKGKRHPTINHGVLLGAGVSILGPVIVGRGSKIGAGAVVVHDLPAHCVAVGVPAKKLVRDVKEQLAKKCGTDVSEMKLQLQDDQKGMIYECLEDDKPIGYYSPSEGYFIHIVDLGETSSSWLEDLSQVEKYEMPDEEYDKREDTFRAFKRRMAKTSKKSEKTVETEIKCDINVGDRCQVDPGDKRGTVRFVGSVSHLKPGIWIGIEYDEPIGKNDGENIFSCLPNHGAFVRPTKVRVGDFPPLDEFYDEL